MTEVIKRINELLIKMERDCIDGDCVHCSRFFYPCGYLELCRALYRWGFEEVWNSNQGNSAISFAPTHMFERDEVVVEVGYSGWDVYYKNREEGKND
jgi:hypothetical protein